MGRMFPEQHSTLVIGPVITVITPPLSDKIAKNLTEMYMVEQNGQCIKLFGKSRKSGPGFYCFYSGLLDFIVPYLECKGINVHLDDRRLKFGFPNKAISAGIDDVNNVLKANCGYQLLPHQEKAVKAGLLHNHGTFQIATSGGKTLCIAALIRIINEKTIVIVDSVELMKQMAKELAKIIPEDQIGMYGAGIKKPNFVTVGIVDSLVNNLSIMHDTGYLVIDEAHLAAANQYRRCVHATKASVRHGFTATYTRSLRGEIKLLYAMTGNVLMRVSGSDLVHASVASRPIITIVDLKDSQYPEAGEISYTTAVRRHIVRNKLRNNIACQYIRSKVLECKTVMVFVSRVEHGRTIRDMLINQWDIQDHLVEFVHGNSGIPKRAQAIDMLRNRDIFVLIATKIFEKGIDIPAVDVGVNLKGEASEIACKQTLGRVLRRGNVGKKEEHRCEYLDFLDAKCGLLIGCSKKRLRMYRSEPAYQVTVVPSKDFLVANMFAKDE